MSLLKEDWVFCQNFSTAIDLISFSSFAISPADKILANEQNRKMVQVAMVIVILMMILWVYLWRWYNWLDLEVFGRKLLTFCRSQLISGKDSQFMVTVAEQMIYCCMVEGIDWDYEAPQWGLIPWHCLPWLLWYLIWTLLLWNTNYDGWGNIAVCPAVKDACCGHSLT